MDSLIESALNAAALRPEHKCERHPVREGTLAIDLPTIGIRHYWCQECRDDYDAKYPSKGFGRAFGTGTSDEAAEEQRYSQLCDEELQATKPHAKVRKYL